MKKIIYNNKLPHVSTNNIGKTIFAIFLSLILNTNIFAQAFEKVTIINKSISFKELFAEIEQQTGYSFFYNNDDFDIEQKVSVNAKNQTIDSLLKQVLPKDFTTKINGKQITLVKKSSNQIKSSEKISINGTIKDENGEPLIGATIVVDGTTNGTITMVDGSFSLNNVPINSTVEFSFIGYVAKKVIVKDQTTFNIVLNSNVADLDEVVVVGYGIQKKSNVTGAISSIKTEDLSNRSASNAASALQGKVSGVQVMNNSGAPGSSSTLRIRGFSSNGVSDPLYIVDGLKVPDIDYLDPDNIDRIEILKDAASAAIYGAEAGNGVVLVTTKTGKVGTSKIFFNSKFSTVNIANKLNLLDAHDYINYIKEAGTSDNQLSENYYNDPSSYVNNKLADTDWQDECFTTGYRQSYTLGMQGANDKGSYFLSLNYLDYDGILKGSQDAYNRISAQMNASYKIKDWIEVGFTNTIDKSKLKKINEDGVTREAATSMIYILDPLTPVEYADGLTGASSTIQDAVADGYEPYKNKKTGNYYGYSNWTGLGNPLGIINRDNTYTDVFNINGTIYGNLKPVKGLIFTSRLGYRLRNNYNYSYTAPYWGNVGMYTYLPELSTSQSSSVYYQWENFANYSLKLNKSTISAIAGSSFIEQKIHSMESTTYELESLNDNYLYLDYSTSSAVDEIDGNTTEKAQIAYYGRLSWDFDDKYNLQFNFRADSYDAAYLDLDHNWGYFPSVSAGWTVSNEGFMKNNNESMLTYLKLRASYGKNGSISNLANYMYSSALITGSYNYYYMNGVLYGGTYPNEYLANPSLRWEESTQIDIGIDARFFSDRLNITADYYDKNTDGLLIESTSNLTTGTSTVFQNVGIVNNHGFEFDIEWKDKVSKNFNYGFKANIATVSNLVKEYKGKGTRIEGTDVGNTDITVSYFEEGYPIWYLRGYKLSGINESDGSPIFEDMDGDNIITAEDKTFIGDGVPDFTYGATLTMNYKNFDLLIYGTGSYGADIMYGLTNHETSGLNRIQFLYDERWTSENTKASRPSAMYQTDSKYLSSDAMVFDGSFFKIKQIQLGYNLPNKWLKKLDISSLRTYVSFENFFTFTSYPGMDPEIRTSSNTTSDPDATPSGKTYSMAIDEGGYPIAKSIMFGINLTF